MATTSTPTDSAWAPFGNSMFRTLWIATLASNIGTWMHDVGAGWLMTSLSPSPVMVALIQTATTLPVFFLALPAGALADIIDRRRYLMAVQVWMAIVAALLAWSAFGGFVTAWSLAGLTFAMGIGTAMMMPAWSAIVPEIIEKRALQPAIALNSMGINVARAIGPALAGVIITFAGTAVVFAINALSFLAVILVLYRWQRVSTPSDLPSERLVGAMRAGLRYARHAPGLRAAVTRGAGFFVFASASWALLPLIAKDLVNGGPQAFGTLVASVGAGAMAGAVVLPKVRKRLSRDLLVALSSLLYAVAIMTLAIVDRLSLLSLTMALSGIAWITVLSSLQVTAQMALPNWVRSRGLAVFMTVFMGSMGLGSLAWGKLADLYGIQQSLLTAAAGLVVATALTWRWKLAGIEGTDMTPSMHWPIPETHECVTQDRGPVLITIQYEVTEDWVPEFLDAIRELSQERRRDGAYSWSVYEDSERPNCFIETFNVESWLEHLRQHERVTGADRDIQERIRTLLTPGTMPIVAHYVAPDRRSIDRPAT